MIIPYGHEGMRVRGLPWVTIVIFGCCCIAFLLTDGASRRAGIQSERLFTEIAEIYLEQPTLVLEPDLEERIFNRLGVDENQREVFLRSLTEGADAARPRGSLPTQKELDSLVAQYRAVYRGSPDYRFGVVPTELRALDLATYQFLHGGWGHLLGNLLFLYLVGPHIEERWGRVVFGGFYLLAGVVAALAWVFRYPDLDIPLIGASGSIAGVMGAFLICYGTSRIRFFYWFFVVWGTFQAPAWLMLPLWLAMEVISGRTMDVMSDGGGGVAHWAHVWGFIFGMGSAFLMGMFGLDRRLAERSTGAAARTDGDGPIGRSPRPAQRTAAGGAREIATRNPPAIDTTAAADAPLRSAATPLLEPRLSERIRLVEAVPRELDLTSLVFEVEKGRRRLALTEVEALAVGAVARDGQRPFLIVDLLLDWPLEEVGNLRILRFRSTSFDPRRLVGGDDVMVAFKTMLEILLSATGATALPDEAGVRAPSRRTYGSVEEYQRRVLGIQG